MSSIVVAGSLNVDIALRAAKIPAPGETVRGGDLVIGPGGKGLNQAIAAARLGASVSIVGCVGDDSHSQIPLEALSLANVNVDHVHVSKDRPTGTALIVIEQASGQNAIAVAGGANGHLSTAHIGAAQKLIANADVLLVQLEAPEATVEAALHVAGSHGTIRILDPAPYRPIGDRLLTQVDFLTPNEREASQLAMFDVHDPESAARAGKRIRERTDAAVLITLGEKGCLWVCAEGETLIEAPAVPALDTTGAGDAFCGALAVELASGKSTEAAIARAVIAGAASTMGRGAAASMPTASELAEFGA